MKPFFTAPFAFQVGISGVTIKISWGSSNPAQDHFVNWPNTQLTGLKWIYNIFWLCATLVVSLSCFNHKLLSDSLWYQQTDLMFPCLLTRNRTRFEQKKKSHTSSYYIKLNNTSNMVVDSPRMLIWSHNFIAMGQTRNNKEHTVHFWSTLD